MEVDYIIVGLGLAGLSMANVLEDKKKSFVVFEDSSHHSSLVAGGMYNPVILKRFTPVWDAENQLKVALPFYEKIEKRFKKKYIYPLDILRLLNSVEEQNNWFAASDKPLLSNFMIPKIEKKIIKGIDAPFGFGKLQNTGRIDTNGLIEDYRAMLAKKGCLLKEPFIHQELDYSNDEIRYQNIKSKKIVFCEGFGMKSNPFFNELPLKEVKGELLTIESNELQLDVVLKSSVFMLPIGKHLYKVGATFNWNDKSSQVTKEARTELMTKLNTVISVPYKVLDQVAGIRPTVKDRRPLVGIHPKFRNMSILNGLGTRGVMLAPKMAEILYNALENGIKIPKEVNIRRFD